MKAFAFGNAWRKYASPKCVHSLPLSQPKDCLSDAEAVMISVLSSFSGSMNPPE